jgi:hypothetical protein
MLDQLLNKHLQLPGALPKGRGAVLLRRAPRPLHLRGGAEGCAPPRSCLPTNGRRLGWRADACRRVTSVRGSRPRVWSPKRWPDATRLEHQSDRVHRDRGTAEIGVWAAAGALTPSTAQLRG